MRESLGKRRLREKRRMAEIRDLTTFEADLIPAEDARPLILKFVREEGGEL